MIMKMGTFRNILLDYEDIDSGKCVINFIVILSNHNDFDVTRKVRTNFKIMLAVSVKTQ